MRYTILVLAVALTAGTTQARADQMVTYYMTGTLTDTRAALYWTGQDGRGGVHYYNHPFAAGDHISWTLQYDRSTPLTPGSYTKYEMQPGTLVLNNIVDQTTGYHFAAPPPNTDKIDTGSNLTLSRFNRPGDYLHFSFEANQGSWQGGEFSNGSVTQKLWLDLNTTSSMPEVGLANLHLNNIPFAFGEHELVGSYFQFQTDRWGPNYSEYIVSFGADVDSLSVSVASTPEPRSLTLFLLGAAGLITHGIRRRLRFRVVSFLAVGVAG